MSTIKSEILKKDSEIKIEGNGPCIVWNSGICSMIEVVGGTNSTMYFKILPMSGAEVIIDREIVCKAIGGDSILLWAMEKEEESKPVPNTPLAGKTIVVDAGHGGKDPGAVNEEINLKEKDLALSIANKLASYLAKAGATVVMTRTDDTYVGLTERATIANEVNADIFISVHINSADSTKATGFEVLVYSAVGKAADLGVRVLDRLGSCFPSLPDRGLKERPDLTVLKKTKMPAILVECGFISNSEEATMMSKEENQTKYALAIFEGAMKYFGI